MYTEMPSASTLGEKHKCINETIDNIPVDTIDII